MYSQLCLLLQPNLFRVIVTVLLQIFFYLRSFLFSPVKTVQDIGKRQAFLFTQVVCHLSLTFLSSWLLLFRKCSLIYAVSPSPLNASKDIGKDMLFYAYLPCLLLQPNLFRFLLTVLSQVFFDLRSYLICPVKAAQDPAFFQ